MEETKRHRRSESEEERDRLSELPDCVLLGILNFVETKYAVRTSILSKRWKELWKRLTTLSFGGWEFRRVHNFNKFVSGVLSNRDPTVSLHNLVYSADGTTASKLLDRVLKYAVLHNVQRLTVDINFIPHTVVPLVFSCQTLTFLKLRVTKTLELPSCLHLPSLRTLHLIYVCFTASANEWAEPFSACNSLNNLLLRFCSVHKGAKGLVISNSNLSSLNLDQFLGASITSMYPSQYKLVFSTPNLRSLTITNYFGVSHQPLSSTCNLACLEEATIDAMPNITYSVFTGWLQLFTNVRRLTISSSTLKIILKDLSNLATMRTKPPCFVRLESLKVRMSPFEKISNEEVNRVVEYLLQNSPMTRVAVINC